METLKWNLTPPALTVQLGKLEYLKKLIAEKKLFLTVTFPYFHEVIK